MKNWTKEEIEMLETMSNEEIADKTGRTLKAVKMQRYRQSGHYIKGIEDRDKVYLPSSQFESKETRIYKIMVLAKRIGVRLKG